MSEIPKSKVLIFLHPTLNKSVTKSPHFVNKIKTRSKKMASYEKRGKCWSVRFRYIDERGLEVNKRLSRDEHENKFLTKKEAEQAYMNFMASIKPHKKQARPKMTYFYELYNDFMEFRKNRIRESTYVNVKYAYEKHILPYWKNFKLDDITTYNINAWQKLLDHYSYRYKTKIRGYFKLILDYGQKYYNTTNNISLSENFSKSQKDKKEMQIWTPEEFNLFINQIEDLKDKTMFGFLYYMGTRKGEMGALQWQNVDLTNKTCTINKSLTKVANGLVLGSATKNSKNRTIAIPKKLLEQLRQLKQLQSKNCHFSNEWFVFGNHENHLTYNPLLFKFNKYYNKAKEKSPTLKRIRIHDFRHSHVSLLINQAQSTLSLSALLYAIAERIGDTVDQVLKTYGHLFPNKQQDLIKTLDNI